jgi:hypothetical protein
MLAVMLTGPGLSGSDVVEPIIQIVDVALIQVVEAAFIVGTGLIAL